MAGARKSAAQLAARERARERAAEFTRRNERLIGLAAEYFEAEADAQRIRDEAKAAAEALIAKAEESAVQASGRAAALVSSMLATGESRAAVAERLGVSVAEVKRAAMADTPGVHEGSADGAEAEVLEASSEDVQDAAEAAA